MNIRKQVRQRRQHRMKQLLKSKQRKVASKLDEPQNKLASFHSGVFSNDFRSDDPEFVWKQQYKEWNRQQFFGDEDGMNRFRMMRLVISIILFFAIWSLFTSDHPWATKGQSWVTAALHEEFQSERLALWYEQTFQGSPAFLPGFTDRMSALKVDADPLRDLYPPVKGTILTAFEPAKQGIQIATDPNEPVRAIDEGRVIFAGKHDSIGYMIVIQHAHQLQSVYGFLEPISIEVNQWVKGGEKIASMVPEGKVGKLYFAVKQGQDYINPADVITFE